MNERKAGLGGMTLTAVEAFDDNYIWMLDDGHAALIVDPGDAAPVLAALDARSLRLAGILVTHHHADHVGGLAGLRERLQQDSQDSQGPIYAPAFEQIPEPCTRVQGGDTVELLGLRFSVIDIPGHTAGHIGYACVPDADAATDAATDAAPVLFCGDTLFSGGCGRLFEGTPAQMHASLQSLATLPGNSRVCSAHEYTLSNLRFAAAVEPDNQALLTYRAWCEAQRAIGLPTLPSSIANELAINPFMRCGQATVAAGARAHDATAIEADASPVAVLACLRQWKNDFR